MSWTGWRKKKADEVPKTPEELEFDRVLELLNALLLSEYLLEPLHAQRERVVAYAKKYGFKNFLPVIPRGYRSIPDQVRWLCGDKKPADLKAFEIINPIAPDRPLKPYFIFEPAWFSLPGEETGEVADKLRGEGKLLSTAEEGIIFLLDELKKQAESKTPRPLKLNHTNFHLVGDRRGNDWYEVQFEGKMPIFGLRTCLSAARNFQVVLHSDRAHCFV